MSDLPGMHALTLIQLSSPWLGRALYVAAKLGIADLLAKGPLPVAELAKRVKVDADPLYRTLRALTASGIFSEPTLGVFELNPAAEPLQSNLPHSVRSIVMMFGEPWHWSAWGKYLEAMYSGSIAFKEAHKSDLFPYLDQDREARTIFDNAMAEFSALGHIKVARAYDFGRVSKIVDVGGGVGRLLISILGEHAGPSGVLFDLPGVPEAGRPLLQKAGLEQRVTLVDGSFFDTVPTGGDLYLTTVIHNWPDDRAVDLLKTVRQAMTPAAKLLMVEQVVAAPNKKSPAKWLDLEMLALVGGRERTEEEHADLLKRGGLRLLRVIPTGSAVSLLEAEVVAS